MGEGSGRWRLGEIMAAGGILLLLAGCSSFPQSMNPVSWWHAAEGGAIAANRPPPPNANAPYPNLSTVPPRPQVTPAAKREQIAAGLIADRANAEYTGPVGPDPSLLTDKHDFALALPPPAPAGAPSASLAAASAAKPPSGPPAPPRSAPVKQVAQQTLVTPSVPPAAASLPEVPEHPPAVPAIPGVAVPAQTAPTPPPVAPPAPAAAAPAAAASAQVVVAFQPASSILGRDGQEALRAFAAKRDGRNIEVKAYGDARPGDLKAQQAVLPLALARGRAIAAALVAAGVPGAAIHVDVEAQGHGGVVSFAP